ncbi:MAG: haloacid dehalogenase type II [Planctomycetaceae bacterium]|mgnify:CR=1 FL=1|jgi:2-haloacid dehalogenase|nr:haloacid dehalogenase type II [Planctomycetaceae bacterium]
MVPAVQALTVDVFGTVTDFRSTIIDEGRRLGEAQGWPEIDWGEFADRWRGGYEPAMHQVRLGELPWTTIDPLHRMILDELLAEYGLDLDEVERDEFNRAWHRLRPWPDVIGGMNRLKNRYIVAALSNGNISLLTRMAKHAGFPWDCVLSAELSKHYKPDPEVYRTAAEYLDLDPGQILMTAAHIHDLEGARAVGFRTAFIPRPDEWGPDGSAEQPADGQFDIVARDFHDLADQLGV